MTTSHDIGTGRISATVKDDGAELTSLRDAADFEYLWQAGPEWPRHAPVLFPIVGRLKDDTLLHEGRPYRMTQHGFARDSRFTWMERTPRSATLRLTDSDATRASYPFPFILDLTYAAEDATLSVTARVANPGNAVLPCGVGAHPAFRWPLSADVPQEAYRLEFETAETGRGRSVEGGLLAGEIALPFEGRTMPLSPALFANDALVIPDVASRSVRFSAQAEAAAGGEPAPAPALAVSWDGYKDLGLWSKPTGAPFLCIEPWFGMASPVGWAGEFADKPGILRLPPGESRAFAWHVTLS